MPRLFWRLLMVSEFTLLFWCFHSTFPPRCVAFDIYYLQRNGYDTQTIPSSSIATASSKITGRHSRQGAILARLPRDSQTHLLPMV